MGTGRGTVGFVVMALQRVSQVTHMACDLEMGRGCQPIKNGGQPRPPITAKRFCHSNLCFPPVCEPPWGLRPALQPLQRAKAYCQQSHIHIHNGHQHFRAWGYQTTIPPPKKKKSCLKEEQRNASRKTSIAGAVCEEAEGSSLQQNTPPPPPCLETQTGAA